MRAGAPGRGLVRRLRPNAAELRHAAGLGLDFVLLSRSNPPEPRRPLGWDGFAEMAAGLPCRCALGGLTHADLADARPGRIIAPARGESVAPPLTRGASGTGTAPGKPDFQLSRQSLPQK
jgi:hypothetical protein